MAAGVYNNDGTNNVGYTIRAVMPNGPVCC
jgi:hypothetical protein